MKNTDIEIITSVKQVLTETKKKIVIIPHENPDGDAIGSALGMAEVLNKYGHSASVVSVNDYPNFLKWFSSDIPVVIYEKDKKLTKELIFGADVMICVDFNEIQRSGHLESMINAFKNTKILIDHHPSPTNFCDLMISEPQYSSTAELVFDVIVNIGLSEFIQKEAAEALYTGVLTDTGSFSHNTSKNAFKVVSELLNYGIDTDKIQSNVYHNFSSNRMNLLGYCLNEKMQVFPEYRAAVISISKEELNRYSFVQGDTEGFVNYPLSINNIVFSALFIEKEGFVKASFRSKGNFEANSFSRNHFSGGGHLNAAGGESKLSLEETILKFTQLLPQYKHQLLETKI